MSRPWMGWGSITQKKEVAILAQAPKTYVFIALSIRQVSFSPWLQLLKPQKLPQVFRGLLGPRHLKRLIRQLGKNLSHLMGKMLRILRHQKSALLLVAWLNKMWQRFLEWSESKKLLLPRRRSLLASRVFVFFCFSVIVAFSLIGFSSSHDLTGPEVEVTGTTTKEKDLTIGAKAVWSSSFVVCSLAFCCVVTSYVDCYSGLKSKRELLVPVFVFGLLVLGMISYYYFGQPLPFLFMVPTLNLLATLLPMLTEAKIIDPITHQCVVSAYGQLTMLVSGGGLRLALDPRANLMFLTCVVKYFTGVTVTAMFSDATTSPTKAVGSVLFTISLVVSSEFLAVATGTLPQGSRSNPFRPSSFYFFANCRGFVSKAGAAFTESDEKIEIGEDAGEAKNFLQRIKELASSLESLPTGSRMRSQALSGTVCGLFCQVDVCIAIANSGLGAKINVSRSTRQTSSEQSGLKLSRALFGKVIGSSQFNGVGAAFPEVGLARLLRGENRLSKSSDIGSKHGPQAHDRSCSLLRAGEWSGEKSASFNSPISFCHEPSRTRFLEHCGKLRKKGWLCWGQRLGIWIGIGHFFGSFGHSF